MMEIVTACWDRWWTVRRGTHAKTYYMPTISGRTWAQVFTWVILMGRQFRALTYANCTICREATITSRLLVPIIPMYIFGITAPLISIPLPTIQAQRLPALNARIGGLPTKTKGSRLVSTIASLVVGIA